MRPVVNEGREIEPQNINTKDLFEVKREEVEKEFLRSIERTKKIPDEPVFTVR